MAGAFFRQTGDFITDSFTNHHTQRPFLVVTAASIALGLALAARWSSGNSVLPKVVASPLKTAQSLESPEFPPDVLPGARDVPTPYGSIRVYEWGPEEGPKVLLVHGISTPCLSLGGLAHALVDRGFRVMLFDLFGRGYSDYPTDIPQDHRLFSTQILLALASSSLSWTGTSSGQFSLIGYSLGGGIATAFASYFPNLLSSLILLAPSGLLRENHISWQSRILYAKGWFPESIITRLVRGRLKSGPLVKPKTHPQNEIVGVENALTEELSSSPQQVLSRKYPALTTAASVAWQVENHPAFVDAFMSSIRHGPIPKSLEFENWQRLGNGLSQRKVESGSTSLPHDKVLIVLGERDNIIFKDDIIEDSSAALEGNAQYSFFSIGHEFPSVEYEELANQLVEFWKQ